jgi:hypothetical protein
MLLQARSTSAPQQQQQQQLRHIMQQTEDTLSAQDLKVSWLPGAMGSSWSTAAVAVAADLPASAAALASQWLLQLPLVSKAGAQQLQAVLRAPLKPSLGVLWSAVPQQQLQQQQTLQSQPQPCCIHSTALPGAQGNQQHQQQQQQQLLLRPSSSAAQHARDPHQQACSSGSSEYPVVEPNPAWSSAAALSSAAAAGASSLGMQSSLPSADGSSSGDVNNNSDDSSSVDASGAFKSAGQQGKSSQGPVLGVLMLVHERGVPCWEAWDSWEAGQQGKAVNE